MAEISEQAAQELADETKQAAEYVANAVIDAGRDLADKLRERRAYSREELVSANAYLSDLPEDKFQEVMQATEERMGDTDMTVEEYAREMEETRRQIEREVAEAEAARAMGDIGAENAAQASAGAAVAAAATVASNIAEAVEEEVIADREEAGMAAEALEAQRRAEEAAEAERAAAAREAEMAVYNEDVQMRENGVSYFTNEAENIRSELMRYNGGVMSAEATQAYEDLIGSINALSDTSIPRQQAVEEIMSKSAAFQAIVNDARDQHLGMVSEADNILANTDFSQTDEVNQVINDDFKELDDTMKQANKDIKGLENEILDMEEELKTLEEMQKKMERSAKDRDAALKLLISNPIPCMIYDLRSAITDLKNSLNHAKTASAEYDKTKANYAHIIGDMVKNKLSAAGSSLVYMAKTAATKVASLCKSAVSKLQDMMDSFRERYHKTTKKTMESVIRIYDKVSGGALTSVLLKELEIAEKAAPYGGVKEFFCERDAIEAMALSDAMAMDKIVTGRKQHEFVDGKFVNHATEAGWIDYSAIREFYQNIREKNWGKDKETPSEKISNAVEKGAQTAADAIAKGLDALDKGVDKAVDFILDLPENLATSVHDLAVEVHAKSLELGAKFMEGAVKFEDWKDKMGEHIKAGLIKKDKHLEEVRSNLYETVDNFLGMEKKQTSEYQPSEKLVSQLEALNKLSADSPMVQYAKDVITNRMSTEAAVHKTLGDVGHSLEYTAKKLAGYVPTMAMAASNDLLGEQVKRNEARIDKIEKKIEARESVKESFKSKAEVLLGKAMDVRKDKINNAKEDPNVDQDKGDERA